MGEKQNTSFQFCFNGFLKVDFQGSRVTSDGGLILVRELDEHLGMNQLIEQHLTDSRRGKNTQLPLADLLHVNYTIRIPANENLEGASPSCCRVRREGPVSDPWSSTRAFSTRQRVGRRLAGWWPR